MNTQDLFNNGTIEFLYKKGLISIDVLCYFQYVEHYKGLRAGGSNYTNAVCDTSDKFSVSVSTVKRAIRVLK